MARGTVGEKPELHIVRRYPVARDKVWAAWTDPQALSQWFGPGEMNSVTVAELDVRKGGRYRVRFRTPDGEEHEVRGEYVAVDPLRELVFSWAWQSTPDRVSQIAVRLRPVEDGTELDFRQTRFFDQAARDNHERGWSMTFAKLDTALAAA
ncbi:SRPBCC domain-containing protein [Ramlibacter terrae]|uniref:SRPBCC domain-containing protein n=1 Tax=Ramlibacter terrae TaxID=2732511 RepID=A0ABX6P4X5_9BURK|nr:SRPBCC domain-containing protein [Ramlibacter terrae]